jgi:hypothetical protein
LTDAWGRNFFKYQAADRPEMPPPMIANEFESSFNMLKLAYAGIILVGKTWEHPLGTSVECRLVDGAIVSCRFFSARHKLSGRFGIYFRT